MLGYFPEARPDELLYSICARCHDRVGYRSKQSIIQDLFGKRTVIASIELPSHLDDLIAALPAGHCYDADQLIDNHTLFPFYGPFLPSERLAHIRQDMHGNKGPTIHMRTGIMASRVSLPRWLRLCSLCVQEDRKQFGECYWHRIHQVPGVEICPIHKIYIQNSNVLAQSGRTRYEFVSAECAVQQISLQGPTPLEPTHTILLYISLDAQWLLSQKSLLQDPKALYHRYKKLLADLDLATHKGRVFMNELQQKFRLHFSPEILEMLHCKIEESINENWLMRLVRKPDNAQHPLHHILLIRFLGLSIEVFFNLPANNQPFGKGPWPCLNPVCTHYKENQIHKCQIIYSQHTHSRPIGAFSCSCGFIYSRTGPDRSLEDILRFSKVKAFGHLWEERLRLLWVDETVSLRGMARQLGVDPLTVKRYATQLGLTFPRPVRTSLPLKEAKQLRPSRNKILEPNIVEIHRAIWQDTIQEYPNAGINKLREKIPDVFIWLYRNDKAWLKEHSPIKCIAKNSPSYIDWTLRDKQLAQAVKETAIYLKTLPGRPVCVSFASIGRTIGQLALLQQHIDKLPLTAEALAESVETRENFAVRRVIWAAEKYREERLHPTKWQLIKYAGVERLVTNGLVQETIGLALKSLI